MRDWLASLNPDQIQAFAALANIGLTVGLLFFAGMQWWVTHRAEVARKTERDADEVVDRKRLEREQDAAYQLVWAEHFRLDSLADSWKAADLVELSLLDLLRPADILSGDWPLLLQTLNHLSVEAGYLGGVARTMAHDLERQVSAFNSTVIALRGDYGTLSTAEQVWHVKEAHGQQLGPLEKGIKEAARELALLVWDAIQHTPAATRDRTLDFSDSLLSSTARGAVKALEARSKALQAKGAPEGDQNGAA